MSPRRSRIAAIVAVVLATCAPAGANSAADVAALKTLFAQPAVDPDMFSPIFSRAISLDVLQKLVDGYRARLGGPVEVDVDGFQYRIVFARGSVGVNISFDQNGKITSLLFHDENSAADVAALQRIMTATHVEESWFDAAYAAVAPAQRVDAVLASLRAKFGDFVRIDTRNKRYYVVFAHGEAHAQIALDTNGKIAYLAFDERAR